MTRKRIMIFCFIFAAVFLCFSTNSLSDVEDVNAAFERGNDHYEKGEYSRAIAEYENIIRSGKENGPVYYNLAGAYFKSGKIGKAILNYERAERLMPRDADLAANYKFAKAKIKGKVLPKTGIWGWRPFVKYYTSFTLDELTLLSACMFFIVIFLLVFLVVKPVKRYKYVVAIIIIMAFMIVNGGIIWYKADNLGKDAIMITSTSNALYGPFDSATKFFTVREGASVTVVDSKEDWRKIRRPDNKSGWVKKNDLEMI